MENIQGLAKLIKESRHVIVITGAGISTASGIPDFRSEEGVYNTEKNENIFTMDFFEENPDKFYEILKDKFDLRNAVPNVAHEVLAKWQQEDRIKTIITQNIDRLHFKAGSTSVLEIHGTHEHGFCIDCMSQYDSKYYLDTTHYCYVCGGPIRPSIVMFDENMLSGNECLNEAFHTDLVLVMGTSLKVSTVNSILENSIFAKKAIINLEPTERDKAFDIVIHGKLEEILPMIDKELGVPNE